MIEDFDYNNTNYPTAKVADVFPFELSENLGHTWIFDLDGTILEVNAPPYEDDKLLPGVKEMWAANTKRRLHYYNDCKTKRNRRANTKVY